MAQVFNFLGIAQGQAREPAIEQPHRKICALDIGSADTAAVRIAAADDYAG